MGRILCPLTYSKSVLSFTSPSICPHNPSNNPFFAAYAPVANIPKAITNINEKIITFLFSPITLLYHWFFGLLQYYCLQLLHFLSFCPYFKLFQFFAPIANSPKMSVGLFCYYRTLTTRPPQIFPPLIKKFKIFKSTIRTPINPCFHPPIPISIGKLVGVENIRFFY